MKKTILLLAVFLVFSSCVSRKKYTLLENDRNQLEEKSNNLESELFKTTVAKKELEDKFLVIEKRVDNYNSKINALKDETNSMRQKNTNLQQESDAKLTVSNGAVLSTQAKISMRNILSRMNPDVVATAKTLKDSMNLAVSYNLNQALYKNNFNEENTGTGNIQVNIEETVVMISIADNLLFNTASYRMRNKADGILQKIADLLESEPSLDLMVEGHTDSRSINTGCLKDNWDLSVLRATSIVRRLEKKFKIPSARLIASGRSSFQPLVDNDSKENRAKNRRTRIIIMPNIDKFFALMAEKQ